MMTPATTAAGPDMHSPLDLVELRAMGGALERPAARNVVAGRGAAWSVGARPVGAGGPWRFRCSPGLR
jgi:hypothetical protein